MHANVAGHDHGRPPEGPDSRLLQEIKKSLHALETFFPGEIRNLHDRIFSHRVNYFAIGHSIIKITCRMYEVQAAIC